MSATLSFFGCEEAELFSKEISASYDAVLKKNFIQDKNSPMYGFVSASVDGRCWTDTMWTRDEGTFLPT